MAAKPSIVLVLDRLDRIAVGEAQGIDKILVKALTRWYISS
jgi:hypothetical protein